MLWEEYGLREAVLLGDEAAWRTLYERTFDAVYAYVYYRTGRQTHRTDDVVQEAWLVAVRRIGSFDPQRGSFEAWLKGIADNVLRNHRRRWQRDARQAAHDEIDEIPAADKRDGGELVPLAMSAIPSHYQALLRAKYQEQLSVAEIACRDGRTEKAVESLLTRARDAFRRAYEKLRGEES